MREFFLKQQLNLKQSQFFREVMLFLAEYAVMLYVGTAYYLIFITLGGLIGLWVIIFIILARLFISEGLHRVLPRMRPYQRYKFKPPETGLMTRIHKKIDSFPSDHLFVLTFSVFLSGLVSYGWFWLGLVLIPLTGTARVVLGYHYLCDILCGIIAGFLWFWVFLYVMEVFQLYLYL